MPDTSQLADLEQTEVGSYFVANYPPFSVWTPDAVATDAKAALASPAAPETPLGLYLHIPFCRKRCHFCYFRVYTDKNAREVEQYLDLLGREWELYAGQPALEGRPFNFVYFGGGTPSFLSTRQLETPRQAGDGRAGHGRPPRKSPSSASPVPSLVPSSRRFAALASRG